MALESLLVLPLVLLVVAAVLATTTVAGDQLAVARAARAGARSVALTGEVGAARPVVQAVRPQATVEVRTHLGTARVTVTARGRLVGIPYEVHATAAAPLEPVTFSGP